MTNERGFTLAELLVSCAVLGLVLAGIVTLQQQGMTAYLMGSARVEVQQNARLALDIMTRELRSALSVTPDAACNNATNGATTITFSDQNGTAVTYALSTTNLQRNTITLIGGVQTFRILCYASDGTTLTNGLSTLTTGVRSVKISLTTQNEDPVAAKSPGNQHAVMESTIRLRNVL
ncbi:MAG: prepilin-type N-terminal cleavage/methylation domain-containing protein [Candidatus Rokubacteria bacterium]|nr:prepilin-type N-terminal cleavage/methylation domain-containing protein [Candidatus Rokubacteria bacterium]